jgi:hypothetical protein
MKIEQRNYVKYFLYFLIVALFFISFYYEAERSVGAIAVLIVWSIYVEDFEKFERRELVFSIAIVMGVVSFMVIEILGIMPEDLYDKLFWVAAGLVIIGLIMPRILYRNQKNKN